MANGRVSLNICRKDGSAFLNKWDGEFSQKEVLVFTKAGRLDLR